MSLCTLRCHEANPLTASLIFPRSTRMQGSYPARGLCITPTRGCSWALVGQSQGHGGIRHGGRRRRTRTTFQGPCSSLPGFPGATVVKSALAKQGTQETRVQFFIDQISRCRKATCPVFLIFASPAPRHWGSNRC